MMFFCYKCKKEDNVWSTCLLDCTGVLSDLSLGDHLLAFRVHEFTILVLFQALEHALSISFRAETLQQQKPFYNT